MVFFMLEKKAPCSGLKTGCSYQAPLLYDAWCPHHVTGYDNVIAPPHPLMAYDNVPKNLLVYDNAPPPGKHIHTALLIDKLKPVTLDTKPKRHRFMQEKVHE